MSKMVVYHVGVHRNGAETLKLALQLGVKLSHLSSFEHFYTKQAVDTGFKTLCKLRVKEKQNALK